MLTFQDDVSLYLSLSSTCQIQLKVTKNGSFGRFCFKKEKTAMQCCKEDDLIILPLFVFALSRWLDWGAEKLPKMFFQITYQHYGNRELTTVSVSKVMWSTMLTLPYTSTHQLGFVTTSLAGSEVHQLWQVVNFQARNKKPGGSGQSAMFLLINVPDDQDCQVSNTLKLTLLAS